MDRRTLLKAMSYGTLSVLGGQLGWKYSQTWRDAVPGKLAPGKLVPGKLIRILPRPDPLTDEGTAAVATPTAPLSETGTTSSLATDHASYFEKIRDFDRSYSDDYVLDDDTVPLLESTARRLAGVQKVYGHGKFNLLSFDTMLKIGRRYRAVGRFPKPEIELLEEVFFADATRYGFYGDKVLAEITAIIPKRDTVKISDTGHYLFRGKPQQRYEQMCKDLNGEIILTSGIRGVVKQMQLFLDKAVVTGGNLSRASRSLAPPGYSYHAAGDFDIGKVGGGLENFTNSFAETDEYKRLVDLGYAELRYPPTNPFGVRHEPWHIKMRT